MADNTTIQNASGTTETIATDDVGGVKYQRVKLDVGGDGVAVPVAQVNSGQVIVTLRDASGNTPAADNGGSDQGGNTIGLVVTTQEKGFAGTGWDRVRVSRIFKNIAAQAVTAGAAVTIWTPAAGRKFRLMGYALSLSVSGSVIFEYGASDTEFLRTPLMAAGVGQPSPDLGNGIMPGAADEVMKIDVTATGTVSGYVYGVEE